jgi:outer membrane protein OmpA-like peptidoglycan-associated protein
MVFSYLTYVKGLCVLVFFWLPTVALTQSAAKWKDLGDQYFKVGRYHDAVFEYSQYQLEKPGDLDVLTNLGISYYQVRNTTKAIEYFEYVLSAGARSAKPEAFYFLAKSYHLQEKWVEAIKYYKFYLSVAGSKHVYRLSAIDEIKRCAFAKELKPNALVTLVQNMGEDVNSKGDEFGPIPSLSVAQRIFFSAAREESVGGYRKEDGLADQVEGRYTSDIFYAEKQTNGSYKLGQLSELINTARHEQLLDFSAGGQVMYYSRGFDLYSGDILVDTAGKKDEHQIEIQEFDGPMVAPAGDQDLFFVHDSLILFASRREGGFGGLDIYYAIKKHGEWEVPVNMGASINTAYDDRSPFLSFDGNTLYFSSNRIEGLGGFDIYSITYDELKKAWNAPKNLASPINSGADDMQFRMVPNGKLAYLASNRDGSFGGYDLFIAYFKQQVDTEIARTEAAFLRKNTEVTSTMRFFKPLSYNNEGDILSLEHQAILEEVAAIATARQEVIVMLTCHTDETGPAPFDLFKGITRAQMVGAALQKLGISANRITVRSTGSGYPAALNVLGDTPNELGDKYNRRITIELIDLAKQVQLVQMHPIQVPEVMRTEGQENYKKLVDGLSYRVRFNTTKQMYADDMMAMFTDLSIEAPANASNKYVYFIGLTKEAKIAAQLRKDLIGLGFDQATVIPYLYGKEITRNEAAVMRKNYPDLVNYLSIK